MVFRLRIAWLLLFDAILVNLAIYISLLLRFDGFAKIPPEFWQAFINLSPWITVLTLSALYFFRLYHRMWQYASLGELYSIVKSVTSSMLIIVFLIYTTPIKPLPRSVYILSLLIMIILIGGSRLTWRIIRNYIIKEASTEAKRTLIIGAGDAGALVARELNSNSTLGLVPIGFIDDNHFKQKLTIYSIPVLGTREDIPDIVDNYGIEEIIIAMPSAGGKTIRDLLNICQSTTASLRIFQGSNDWLHSRTELRAIQLEDLLRREPVAINLDEIATYLKEKIVLISGAGGSIGSELCRQLCQHGIKQLVLLDSNENNLFEINNELKYHFPNITVEAEIADIKDRLRLQQIFNDYRPEVVFHAAAYKHVPLMEQYPAEAVKNNVLGSKNIAEIADEFKVGVFILISTDKAVNPNNVMGATKRIAELLISEVGQKSQTRFAAVRFGNVLGSRGSVVPTFKKQIEEGGPITITHPDMTRYFMTIPEAVQLVIQAGAMAKGGEIFVLDMGEPVKIMDLASDLLHLYGLEPDRDIDIEVTGIRPGEKLYEELFTAREQMAATNHERILISTQPIEQRTGKKITEKIEIFFSNNSFISHNEALDLLHMILPEFGNGKEIGNRLDNNR